MWEAISSFLSDLMPQQIATDQTPSMASNIANGAMNSGWGSMAADLRDGNYASAVGNAMSMDGDYQPRPRRKIPTNQLNSELPQPYTPSQPQPLQAVTGATTTPYLQQLMQRYMR